MTSVSWHRERNFMKSLYIYHCQLKKLILKNNCCVSPIHRWGGRKKADWDYLKLRTRITDLQVRRPEESRLGLLDAAHAYHRFTGEAAEESRLGLLDAAHDSPAVVCFHLLQGLFQLLSQVQQGGWVCLQNVRVETSILVKVELYSHWWFNLLPEASACKLSFKWNKSIMTI